MRPLALCSCCRRASYGPFYTVSEPAHRELTLCLACGPCLRLTDHGSANLPDVCPHAPPLPVRRLRVLRDRD